MQSVDPNFHSWSLELAAKRVGQKKVGDSCNRADQDCLAIATRKWDKGNRRKRERHGAEAFGT
jgi:hypothetical protein